LDEEQLTLDGKFTDHSHYWIRCVDSYKKLGKAIKPDNKETFNKTKLMLLNPQAHHSL
jgi:hypothetical protein